MLMGVAMTQETKNSTLYVEYRKCDQCNGEYRLYRRSGGSVEEAFQKLAMMMGNKPDEQDLCFDCQNKVIGNQVMLPIPV